jgi:tetratricopeptide (TPR) repeat protein
VRRVRTALATGATVVGLSVALLATGALGGSPAPEQPAPVVPALSSLEREQQHLKNDPKDVAAWAALGVHYVGQARVTGDPSWYAKAQGAVAESLRLNRTTNFLGYAGEAILANARHDFRAAETAARKGIAINGYNSTLYGALGDALTQLGRYDEAAAAVDKMNTLLPGIPAFTRASYVFELRGDVTGSRHALDRALTDATSPSDRAFTEYYLGELDLHYGGGARKALTHYEAGLAAAPSDAILLAGQAKALAALGQVPEALSNYEAAVTARPEPQTVLEFAELLDSVSDPRAAAEYDLLRVQLKLYASSGVALDTEQTLFEADHGTPAAALAAAIAGWRSRPFVEMADAYAWALHVNHRDREALAWSQRAFASGWQTAPALYHRGMIRLALGDRSAGRADLTKALALDPHFSSLGAPKARAALA